MGIKRRLRGSLYAILSAFVVLAGCGKAADQPKAPAKPLPAGTVRIEWFGQSMFLLTTHSGLRLVTDPFNAQLGYPLPHPEADIVTVTHEHFDHNAVEEVRGKFEAIRSQAGVGEHTVKGVLIKGIAAFHDEEQGKKRGPDTIFTFTLEGLRFCHLGDLGQSKLTAEQLKAIGPVDVLMIPVGGFYTIDGKTAWDIITQLKPRAILPMHYKTKVLNPKIPIHPVDEFTAGHQGVKLVKSGVLELSAKTLPKEQTVYVLDKFD